MAKYIFVCTIVLIAMIIDIKTYKIPNVLCLISLGVGILYSILYDGLYGIYMSLVGMILPIIVLFGFFALGIMGAGDIKLFAALGAFIHLEIWKILLLSFAVMIPIGIGAMIFGKKEKIKVANRIFNLTKIHYSVPIFIAVVGYTIGGIVYGI